MRILHPRCVPERIATFYSTINQAEPASSDKHHDHTDPRTVNFFSLQPQ